MTDHVLLILQMAVELHTVAAAEPRHGLRMDRRLPLTPVTTLLQPDLRLLPMEPTTGVPRLLLTAVAVHQITTGQLQLLVEATVD